MRFPAICLSVVAFGLLTSSCSHSSRSDAILLRVATWGGVQDNAEYTRIQQEIYHEFERQNPGVQVRVESIADNYNPKIILSHIANAAPDAMCLDASYAALHIGNGVVRDLTPYLQREPELANEFFPNVWNIARMGDKQYAIPIDFTPMVMYYNKDLFDQAGVPYPDGSWNFAKFREVAKKLTKANADPAKRQYGFAFSNWMPGWVMWLWNNGGDVVSADGTKASGTFDSPKNQETFGFIAQLVKDGIAPSMSQMAAQGVDPFANGQAAMQVSGHWQIISYKAAPKDASGKPRLNWKRLGVCALPHNGPQSQTVMYESGWAIPTRSKHPDLAWKFIRYMTSAEVQRKFQSSGIAVCARKDIAKERAKDPFEAQFIPLIPLARAPNGTRIENYDFVEKRGQDAMSAVLQSGRSPQFALERAAQRIDKEFAKR